MRINTVKIFLVALLIFGAVACEGPEGLPGPPGPQGPPGFDGVNITSQVFELDNINLLYDADNNLWTTQPISFDDIEVFEADAVLVYRFDGTVDLDDGSTADAWSQIPQNFFLPEGTIQYVFAHTFVDFEIFIDGNFDLSALSTDFTDGQIFRVVVVPGTFAENPNIDFSNLDDVMKALQIDVSEIDKMPVIQ